MEDGALHQEATLLTEATPSSIENGLERDSGQPTHKITDPTTTPSAGNAAKFFPWELAPFEIREQIFETLGTCFLLRSECPGDSYFRWCREVPPLVVALRSLKISYDHVIKHFKKHNRQLYLGFWNSYNVAGMTKRELEAIESVHIDAR